MLNFQKFLIVAAAAIGSIPSAKAVSSSWLLTSGSGSWNDGANWSSGVPLASGTASLTSTLTATATSRLVTSGTVGVLNISSGNAFNMVLNAAAGSSLTMNNGASAAQINIGTVGSTNNVVINSVPIQMTTSGLVISASTSTARTISGTISSGVAGNSTLTLRSLAGGNLTVNSVIANGAGTVGVVVDNPSAGLIFLGGANTFTGGLTVRNGGITGVGNSLGAGTVTLGDASTTSGGSVFFRNTTGVVSNNIVVSSLAPTNASATIFGVSGGGDTVYSGTVALQKQLGVTVSSGTATVNFSGAVTGTGSLNLTNGGGGTSRTIVGLSGSSSFSGGVTVSDRVSLNLGHANALGTGTFTVSGTSTTLDSTQANLVLATNNAIALNNNLTYVGTGGNSLNVGTGTVTFAGNKTITVSGGVLTIGGMIVAGNNLTKDGNGVLSLNGANTYSGETSVTAGTLRGTGSILGDLFVSSGATLEAGNSIGTFTAGGLVDLTAGGTFKFELNSTTGAFDQLVANGVSLDGAAQFTLSDLGSGLWSGGTIIAINNTSGDAILGTFSGLSEGATVTLGSNDFIVSYVGGDGNDFTLQTVPEPGAWMLLTAGLCALALRRRKVIR